MKSKTNLLKIFNIFALGILTISAIYIITNPNSLSLLTDSKWNTLFSDFEIHIDFSKNLSQTYYTSMHACFPPFIYLFYHLIGVLIPQTDSEYAILLLYVVTTAVLYTIFGFVFSKALRKNDDASVFIALILLCLSTTSVFGIIERANIVFLVSILLIVSCMWRNSKSKVKREAALLCIAAAAAIKIYPAVFGLIYICEKRYKEAVRLIIYGILFFFVPFAFTGGINGFLQFLSNQKNVHETWGRLSKISIYSLSKLFGVPNNAALIISAVFALVAIIMFFLAKKNWQKYFALIFIMVMCPMWSGQYTICLFFLPFIEFIREENNNNINILNILYAVMFSLFLSSSIFDRSTTEIKNFLGILMLFMLILFQIINDKKRSRC